MSYDVIKKRNRRNARAWLDLPKSFSPSDLGAPARSGQIIKSTAATQATGNLPEGNGQKEEGKNNNA